MSTVPRTWVVGEVVTAAELNAEIRDQFNEVLAAGVSYTPTWAGYTTLGTVTVHGRVSKIGRWVDFIAEITLVSGSTMGTGTITVTLPYTASSAPAGNLAWYTGGRHSANDGTAWKDVRGRIAPGGTVATVLGIRQTDLGWLNLGSAGGYGWSTAGANTALHGRYEAAS